MEHLGSEWPIVSQHSAEWDRHVLSGFEVLHVKDLVKNLEGGGLTWDSSGLF